MSKIREQASGLSRPDRKQKSELRVLRRSDCRTFVIGEVFSRRGVYHDVPQLIASIEHFIDGYNQRAQPFVWTKTPTRC